MDDGTSITASVFSAYLKCALKAHLLVAGQTVPSSYFADNEEFIAKGYKTKALRHLRKSALGFELVAFSEVSRDIGSQLTTRYVDCEAVAYSCVQSDLECEEFSARKAASELGYAPVLFSARNKPDLLDNLLLCFGALAIRQVVGALPEVGKLIYGECHRCKTVTVICPNATDHRRDQPALRRSTTATTSSEEILRYLRLSIEMPPYCSRPR